MITILDSICQNADPMRHLNLNKRKAAYFLEKVNASSGQEKLTNTFNYTVELMKSGQNESAIMQLKAMIQITGDQLTEQTKILYDFLALAYMRIGEQENCIDTHTSASCVLPIAGEGFYKMTSGPENAIKVYNRILEAFPNDLQTRWLYNLAYMNLGKWPQDVPKAFLLPPEIFKSRGSIRFEDVAIAAGLDLRSISGGVCLEDFDNDGNIDVFVIPSGKWFAKS